MAKLQWMIIMDKFSSSIFEQNMNIKIVLKFKGLLHSN